MPAKSSIFETMQISVDKDGNKLRPAKISKESHLTEAHKQRVKIAAERELKKRGDLTLLKTSISLLNG